MIKHIQNKIQSLKNELSAIDYTVNVDEIKLGEFDKHKKIFDIISKIQVLNEVIISFGVQDK